MEDIYYFARYREEGGEKSLEIARMIRKYLLDGVKGGGNFYIFLE